MHLILLLTLILFSSPLLCKSQKKRFCPFKDSLSKPSKIKPFIAPAALMATSGLIWSQRDDVKNIRDRHFRNFHNKLDDHMYLLPIGAVYGLNLAGVKGKNHMVRATAGLALSYAIGSPLVDVMKNKIGITRPSGYGNNSFPSWHTARAFIAATYLHKEYGHLSPWYTVGAYGTAGATALWRILNNAHWASDVLAGAAIGILVTETSYLLLDLILKDRWQHQNAQTFDSWDEEHPPHYLALRGGAILPMVKHSYSSGEYAVRYDQRGGASTALEGTYFLNERWGIGGQLGFSNFNYDFGPKQEKPTAKGTASLHLGPTYRIPLGKKFDIQTQANLGLIKSSSNSLVYDGTLFSYNYNLGMSAKIGTSVSYKIGRRTKGMLFGELAHFTEKGELSAPETKVIDFRHHTSYFNLGVGLAVGF